MSYKKDLGRVKGDKGVGFKPQKKNETAKTATIGWIPTEDNYVGPIPDDVVIQKSLILPVIENNTLSWYQANDNPEAIEIFKNIVLPNPTYIKGDKGDTGNTKINILIYETLEDINIDDTSIDDTSTLYYIGNDETGYAVYAYDPNYENKYRKIGLSSIDLSDYYKKNEIHTILEDYATIKYVNDNIAQAIDLIDKSIIPRLG